MGTIIFHSNQSSYPTGIKSITFRPPTYRCFVCNMERIGLTASEVYLVQGLVMLTPLVYDLIILPRMRKIKGTEQTCGCAGWSAPLLFACTGLFL